LLLSYFILFINKLLDICPSSHYLIYRLIKEYYDANLSITIKIL
jgi:hypothetical protein